MCALSSYLVIFNHIEQQNKTTSFSKENKTMKKINLIIYLYNCLKYIGSINSSLIKGNTLRKNVKKKKKVSMAAEKGRKNQIRSQLEK